MVAANLLEGNRHKPDYRGVPSVAFTIINLFALAIRHELTADDLKTTMFAYPTGASDIGSML